MKQQRYWRLNAVGEPEPWDGKEPLDSWSRGILDDPRRNLAREKFPDGGPSVSTIFLCINHQKVPGQPPLLFETMIFAHFLSCDRYCKRYSTREEAIRGHAVAVEIVRKELASH